MGRQKPEKALPNNLGVATPIPMIRGAKIPALFPGVIQPASSSPTIRFQHGPMKNHTLLAAAAAASWYATSALADLTYFEAARWRVFTQNSDAPPAAHNSFGFTGRIFTNTANQVQNGTVETPLTTVYVTKPEGSLITGYSHFGFATESALDVLYPTGTYTFTLTNGPRAGDTDTLVFNDPGWPDAIPAVTGTTYSDLQGADVTKPITLTWASFDAPGTHTSIQTYLNLRNLTTNTGVFGQQGKPDVFRSKTFAANTLEAGHEYQFQLSFGALDQKPTLGELAPAAWTSAKYFSTNGRFRTAAPPIGPVDIQFQQGNTASITWNGAGTLERSTDLVTWTPIADAANPFIITISPSDPALYFRQRIP